MTEDALSDEITSALNEQWPDAFGHLERKPSKSALKTPLFVLHWTGPPSMADVRAMLDAHPVFSKLSVMFSKRAGES